MASTTSAGSRRRRVSSAVPSSEGAATTKGSLGGRHHLAAAEIDAATAVHDDDHHVPRLLKPLPQIPWHRPAAPAAWAPHADASHPHRTLLSREDAPKYLTGNPYVLHGFRRVETLWEAVDGLWYMHNAFWDAWTSIGSFVHSHV